MCPCQLYSQRQRKDTIHQEKITYKSDLNTVIPMLNAQLHGTAHADTITNRTKPAQHVASGYRHEKKGEDSRILARNSLLHQVRHLDRQSCQWDAAESDTWDCCRSVTLKVVCRCEEPLHMERVVASCFEYDPSRLWRCLPGRCSAGNGGFLPMTWWMHASRVFAQKTRTSLAHHVSKPDCACM
jgi:hypothetical protein